MVFGVCARSLLREPGRPRLDHVRFVVSRIDLFGMMMSGRISCGGRLRTVARSGPTSWPSPSNSVALGADALETPAGLFRVAVHLQCRFVSLQHFLPLARALLEQGPRALSELRVAAHEQLALVSKAQRPRLNGVVLDGRQQHSRTVRIAKHGVGGLECGRQASCAPVGHQDNRPLDGAL